jgi:hypothetical protein
LRALGAKHEAQRMALVFSGTLLQRNYYSRVALQKREGQDRQSINQLKILMTKMCKESGQKAMAARLLRHRETRRYFRDEGWTESPDEAKVFFDVVEAAETCVEHGLKDVELTVRVRAESCDLFCTEFR